MGGCPHLWVCHCDELFVCRSMSPQPWACKLGGTRRTPSTGWDLSTNHQLVASWRCKHTGFWASWTLQTPRFVEMNSINHGDIMVISWWYWHDILLLRRWSLESQAFRWNIGPLFMKALVAVGAVVVFTTIIKMMPKSKRDVKPCFFLNGLTRVAPEC